MRAGDAKVLLRSAPVRSFEEIVGPRPLLILAPHADDESLGCGGLIAEACARDHEVRVAILTDGAGSHPNSVRWPRERLVAEREHEAAAAVRALGLDAARLLFLRQPDTAVPIDGPGFGPLVDRLLLLLVRDRIGTVCTSWRADPHCDHEAAASLAAAACEKAGTRHLFFPVWAWTLSDDQDVPDPTGRAMRLDITRHLPRKRRAIACHATQHSGLIDDDPTGFTLPPDFLVHFDQPTEVFITEP